MEQVLLLAPRLLLLVVLPGAIAPMRAGVIACTRVIPAGAGHDGVPGGRGDGGSAQGHGPTGQHGAEHKEPDNIRILGHFLPHETYHCPEFRHFPN
ncbi:hypothetical protein GCM10011574_00810 [Microbispora bryophytorum]|uniref:Uncharacterized protein n=1 Tax=Microbispora bryophytorum TaxID=1460882 RepID=A0A8H9GTB7_9ACTN|nr:hypothetical protein GCM10011574_00810 [Microbispora bryophytorum]